MTPSSTRIAELARAAGFDLVGFARAEPIPATVLTEWLEAGYHADLDWMRESLADRLDVGRILPGAKTVVALACNCWPGDAPSPIAAYARGRDYHATLRDRLRTLRRTFRAEFPGVADYGSVDTNPVMERVWAARAGLGYVGKNGCLITAEFGSFVMLGAFILDAEVDGYADGPAVDRCGKCTLCLTSCPTSAFVRERVVDATKCLSFHSIESEKAMPVALRPAMEGMVFGCDVCQAVCPLNAAPVLAGPRFAPRPVAGLSIRELAALGPEEFTRLTAGTPLARAGYDGVRRNAAYALGAAKEAGAKEVLQRLAADASEVVRDAAEWALARIGS
jgi:epoxyqueuosine reductase